MCVIRASVTRLSAPLAMGWGPGCVSKLSSLVSIHAFCSPRRGGWDAVSLPPVGLSLVGG